MKMLTRWLLNLITVLVVAVLAMPIAFAQATNPSSWSDVFTPERIASLATLLSGFVTYAIINVFKLNPTVQGALTNTLNAVLNAIFTALILAAFNLAPLDALGLLRFVVLTALNFLISRGVALGLRQAATSTLEKYTVSLKANPPKGK